MAQDYPDGMTRMLPGHTVDLENGFARPWYEGSSVVIAAGASGSYTLEFSDDDGIYYIDVVNVSPSAYKEFTVIIHINDVPYVCGSVMGFFFFNLRLNPSLLFISGDSVKVEILNLDSSQRTFSVKLNGTKVTRPVGFGKPPGAYYTASPLIGLVPLSVAFVDGSDHSPVSWEWKVVDDDVDSVEQDPTIVIADPGVYSPRLKVSNQYGNDTFARADYITCLSPVSPASAVEVDPNSHIGINGEVITCADLKTNESAYVYRDYGASYFNGFCSIHHIKVTSIAIGGIVCSFMISNNVDSAELTGGYGVLIYFFRSATSTYTMYLSAVSGGSSVASDTMSFVVGTDYYIKVVRSPDSTSIYAYVYSDADMTTLVDTLVVTHAACSTLYRYLYLISSYNNGGDFASSLVSSWRGILSL